MRLLTTKNEPPARWARRCAMACALGGQLLASGCTREGRQASSASASTALTHRATHCQANPVETANWQVVAARAAPFSMSLPPNAERVRGDSLEMWRAGAGTISYSVTPRSTHWLDSAQAADTSGAICEDTIGGHRVRIQYHYGREPFGEGHYLLAFWSLAADQELELIAFSRSPSGRDTLFAVARSVRFADRQRR